MNREDIAWIAGMYEGEGWCGVSYTYKKGVAYPIYQVVIASTDRDILERIQSILAFGKIYGPYFPPKSKKGTYKYSLGSFEYVQAFIAMVWPWLGFRRQQQACDCLGREYIHEYD